ncbi:hypothetical protein [Paraburkholderia solisilvae]|uniref:Type VI secretion system lipoprotein TssJ n=1 Tax=Paraburkholderia solisilvae TaxID=624376 RepID=A0A6J5E1V4_9BURK|nr:hypothetical protein [Paraburkholderia solisilvae]CAB3760460.1 hypothetical protein LMG29739_03398 [Paraburkholderia solisilvae]
MNRVRAAGHRLDGARARGRRHVAARAVLAMLAAAASLTAGCGWFGPPTAKLRELTIVATTDANRSSATALDLVFVYDRPTASALPRSGPDWFAHRAELETALGPKISVRSVQLPPNQSLGPLKLSSREKDALTVYCYVNFVVPAGQGVADLTPYKRMRITLSPGSVAYDGTR